MCAEVGFVVKDYPHNIISKPLLFHFLGVEVLLEVHAVEVMVLVVVVM